MIQGSLGVANPFVCSIQRNRLSVWKRYGLHASVVAKRIPMCNIWQPTNEPTVDQHIVYVWHPTHRGSLINSSANWRVALKYFPESQMFDSCPINATLISECYVLGGCSSNAEDSPQRRLRKSLDSMLVPELCKQLDVSVIPTNGIHHRQATTYQERQVCPVIAPRRAVASQLSVL